MGLRIIPDSEVEPPDNPQIILGGGDNKYSNYIIPNYAFKPDEWTEIFQEGLRKGNLGSKIIHEVGVGIGANVVLLLELGAKKVTASDLDSRLPELATRNVVLNSPNADRFEAIEGSNSLLDFINKVKRKIEVIVACIPQAILPKDVKKSADDTAHYYPEELFSQYNYNKYALGLNEALIKQTQEKLPDSEIILNLAGRVGLDILLEMFESYCYKTTILNEAVIPQCTSTNLKFFLDLEEKLNVKCEFFKDEGGLEKIGAKEAEERRLSGKPLFHKIYVIKGTPKKINKQ